MAIIRVNVVPEFMFGDNVVLVAMDGDGVTAFASALKDAAQQGSSRLELGDVTYELPACRVRGLADRGGRVRM